MAERTAAVTPGAKTTPIKLGTDPGWSKEPVGPLGFTATLPARSRRRLAV